MSIIERLSRRGSAGVVPAYAISIHREADGESAGFDVGFPVAPGRVTIGGSPNCDHVILGCPFDVLCVIKLSADGRSPSLTSGILGAFYEGEPVELGESVPLRVGGAFRADPFVLMLDGTEPSPADRFDRPTVFSVPNMESVGGLPSRRHAIVGLGTMGFASLLLAGFYPSSAPPTVVRPASALPAITDLSTSDAVVVQMRRRLLELGVSDQAGIVAKDGRVEVELPEPVSERNLLLAVADEIRLRTRIPIVTRTAVDDRVLSLVSAVSLTPARVVVGRDGRIFSEGDMIVDDWQVTRIDDEGVIFSRRGEQVALSLDDLR